MKIHSYHPSLLRGAHIQNGKPFIPSVRLESAACFHGERHCTASQHILCKASRPSAPRAIPVEDQTIETSPKETIQWRISRHRRTPPLLLSAPPRRCYPSWLRHRGYISKTLEKLIFSSALSLSIQADDELVHGHFVRPRVGRARAIFPYNEYLREVKGHCICASKLSTPMAIHHLLEDAMASNWKIISVRRQ